MLRLLLVFVAAEPEPAPAPELAPLEPPPLVTPAPEETSTPAPPLSDPKTLTEEDWDSHDWLLTAPRQSLVDVQGYYRLRGDFSRNLDLGNGATWENVARYRAPPDGEANTYGSAMRLRLAPTLNVSTQVRLKLMVDVFDNLILGSTPTIRPQGTAIAPPELLSGSQGLLTDADAIRVKHAFVELTALNEQLLVRAGRMPDHWGLGLLANDGACVDCDYGSVVDRLSLTFKALGHFVTPAFTWVANGPMQAPFALDGAPRTDALNTDDAYQYSLRLSRVLHPDDLAHRLAEGEAVVEYGLWNAATIQARAVHDCHYGPEVTDTTPIEDCNSESGGESGGKMVVRRDGLIYLGDGFLKWQRTQLSIALEVALVAGYLTDTWAAGSRDKTTILQTGGALDLQWRPPELKKGALVGLRAGAASGDSHKGFGALDQTLSQRGLEGAADTTLNNFQFNPEYRVGRLLFPSLIGTVTDAWYVRPELRYPFDRNVLGLFGAMYGQALSKTSTPGRALPLGLELDAQLLVGAGPDGEAESSVAASLGYALLVPLSAFHNLALPEADQSADFVQAISARLFVRF